MADLATDTQRMGWGVELLRGHGMLGARRVYAPFLCQHDEFRMEWGAGACDCSSSIFPRSAYQDATESVRQRLVPCS